MPHIIVEYAEHVATDDKVKDILDAIHNAIADSQLFKANQVKTRAYPFKHFTNAGSSEPYIHIQARIKSGRDTKNKTALGKVILDGLASLTIPADVITVEIIDMERESYGKLKP